ncbi:MAG: GTP cyclohydrolase [Flavobacteriaceae bacterium]|nr:GTP cyclohydrolase [Flavobacteriaceae bacterium]
MITIKKAVSKKEIKQFVTFPFSIYKDSKYWVPPIISEEIKVFDKNTNPVLQNADAHLFLAYKNGKIVGRVAAIINWLEIKNKSSQKIRFGWMDMIDDIEVTKALLAKVESIGKANNLKYMEGPIGFSNLDKVGVLTYGYDHIGTMITWYNHPYYVAHLNQLNLKVEKEYLEHKHQFSDIIIEDSERLEKIIKERYNLRALDFTSTKELMPYADKMFDLFNESYASLSSFVAITDIQKAFLKKKFLNFINPEYIKFVVDETDNLVAFGVVMPSFAEALQKMKGKLFPFGIFQILKAKKSKKLNFYLIGVDPKYQKKGVHSIIFSSFYKTFKKNGIIECRRTPELVNNLAIQKLWRNFNPILIKKRSTFRKEL